MLGCITKRKSTANEFNQSLLKHKIMYENLKKQINFLNNIYWCHILRFAEPSSVQDVHNCAIKISNLIDDLHISTNAIIGFYKQNKKYLKQYQEETKTILYYTNNIVSDITYLIHKIEEVKNYNKIDVLLTIHKDMSFILNYMLKEKYIDQNKGLSNQI